MRFCYGRRCAGSSFSICLARPLFASHLARVFTPSYSCSCRRLKDDPQICPAFSTRATHPIRLLGETGRISRPTELLAFDERFLRFALRVVEGGQAGRNESLLRESPLVRRFNSRLAWRGVACLTRRGQTQKQTPALDRKAHRSRLEMARDCDCDCVARSQ